jgi:hypothetical protein
MDNHTAIWSTIISSKSQARRKRGLGFLPGAFFLFLGLLVAFAPQFVIAAIATLFVFFGLLFCFAAWKIAQFKRTLRNIASEVEANVSAQSGNLRHPDIELKQDDYKKIVFH